MTTATVERISAARLPALGAIAFAVVLAMASQVAIPIPGTPVPITLQPLVVVLAGLLLGPAAAAASMVMYLAAGAAGLPVFAPVGAPGLARLLGPTGGYLLAYPAAAVVAGARDGGRRAARRSDLRAVPRLRPQAFSFCTPAVSRSSPSSLAASRVPWSWESRRSSRSTRSRRSSRQRLQGR